MKWFGESWGAPCNEPQDRVRAPVGSACGGCFRPVGDEDQGLLLTTVSPAGPGEKSGEPKDTPWHIDCLLRRIGAQPRPALSGLRAAIRRVRQSFGGMSAILVCPYCGTSFPRKEAELDDGGRPQCIACGKAVTA